MWDIPEVIMKASLHPSALPQRVRDGQAECAQHIRVHVSYETTDDGILYVPSTVSEGSAPATDLGHFND